MLCLETFHTTMNNPCITAAGVKKKVLVSICILGGDKHLVFMVNLLMALSISLRKYGKGVAKSETI